MGEKVVQDIVKAGQGASTYTVDFIARRFDTKLKFLGRQDNGYSFLTGVSVTWNPRFGEKGDNGQ